ncbi:MAG: TerB family tellurite resistance protein [Pseudomonadales bacterium]|nr:TerB family tellurite resistance protein [Pseudomonadales bacterium]MBO6566129.1 TerB family tellurite resistance protein [Pseudomonadales bacterium]MBO6595546.1 TerB family tellurite resistance protein [Pseudomonadales bacterium]MBO6658086.1 TerB family tellurite resistance protein [Pseudomonadales bacterium]MBO6702045.1 TerB family tellurite resistance protein [Pseudomonadales bacterium]
MSWLGKILGGGLGFVVGGPLGAILGAVVGHHAVDKNSFSRDEERQSLFFLATFSMLGKLSKADGRVTTEEIEVVEQVMRDNLGLSPEARQFAIDIFSAAKDANDRFEDYANQFYSEFQDYPEVLSSLVDLLLRLAHADGVMHPAENALIEDAVRIFRIPGEYAQLKARYSDSNDLQKSYETLGAEEGETLADIKKKYRKLAMEYHPDRVQARGVSPELAAACEERFKEIQQAFDVIERQLS